MIKTHRILEIGLVLFFNNMAGAIYKEYGTSKTYSPFSPLGVCWGIEYLCTKQRVPGTLCSNDAYVYTQIAPGRAVPRCGRERERRVGFAKMGERGSDKGSDKGGVAYLPLVMRHG